MIGEGKSGSRMPRVANRMQGKPDNVSAGQPPKPAFDRPKLLALKQAVPVVGQSSVPTKDIDVPPHVCVGVCDGSAPAIGVSCSCSSRCSDWEI